MTSDTFTTSASLQSNSLRDLLCPHCQSADVYTERRPPHLALMCGRCRRWIKWLPQGRPVTAMPFGCHSGSAISSLPINYINFILENVEIRGSLYSTLAAEFERRGKDEA